MRKNGKVAGVRWWMPGSIRSLAVSMLSMDEPDHTRLRSIVDEAFRRRTVLDMEPRVFAIADELAAELFTDGTPADLVERYARRLPLLVICELLGLPRADRPRFIAWANNLTRLTGMASFLRLLAGIGPMRRYLEGRLQAARETGGEGLIAELVRVEREGGRISNQEMVAMVFLSGVRLKKGQRIMAMLAAANMDPVTRAGVLARRRSSEFIRGWRRSKRAPRRHRARVRA